MGFLFSILFFFTPLLLWPSASEVFEFPKMIFVYIMTATIIIAWVINIFKSQKLTLRRTPLDLPLLLFLLSQIISTILSINPYTSIWGYYSRFHGGLASTICYILLYYALINNFEDKKFLQKPLLGSAILISFYAVLEHLGIDRNVWVQDVQNRVFSTLGQPNWLAAYLLALLPIPLFKVFETGSSRSSGKIHAQHAPASQERVSLDFSATRLGYLTLSLLILVSIVFTKSQSGLFATGIVLTLFVTTKFINTKRNLLLASVAALIAIFLFHSQITTKISPFISVFNGALEEATARDNATRFGGSNSMLIRRTVWTGAIELGKKYPLFGTGVETFGYTYYWVRPAIHNMNSEWEFLYNKAHNEYLNFLANTGFIGLGTYLLLIISIIWLFIKTPQESPLLLGFISILITNFFGFSVVDVALFFFLFPALIQNPPISITINLNFLGKVLLSTVTLLAGYFILTAYNIFASDLLYNSGKNLLTYGDLKPALEKLSSAISTRPNEPLFYSSLSEAEAQAVAAIDTQLKDLPASASAMRKSGLVLETNYKSDAINHLNYMLQLNPYHTNFYKSAAKTYLYLALVDPQYNQQALEYLTKLTSLAPTDAKIYYNLGVLYSSLGNKDLAKQNYQKALTLKPDYDSSKTALDNLK